MTTYEALGTKNSCTSCSVFFILFYFSLFVCSSSFICIHKCVCFLPLSLSVNPVLSLWMLFLSHLVLLICSLFEQFIVSCCFASMYDRGEGRADSISLYYLCCLSLLSLLLPPPPLSKLTKNPEFAGFLDLCPSARLVLQSFVRLDFRSCFLHMKKLKVLSFGIG